MAQLSIRVGVILLIGFLFAQLPVFWEDYARITQAELQDMEAELDQVDQLAAVRQMDRFDYVIGLLDSNDPAVHAQGEFYVDMLSRRQNLFNASASFEHSKGADSILQLLLFFDGKSFLRTLLQFIPGFTLSTAFFGHWIFGIALCVGGPFIAGAFKTRYVPMPEDARMEDEEDEEDQLEALLKQRNKDNALANER